MNIYKADIAISPSSLYMQLNEERKLNEISEIAEQEDVDKHLNDVQTKVLLITKITIIALGVMLLLFAIFNIINYLVIRRRYRNLADLFFYINVIFILTCSCIEASMIPTEQLCAYNWLVVAYISLMGNVNLGVCQATTLTELFIQVK